jgi:hypothetical protein
MYKIIKKSRYGYNSQRGMPQETMTDQSRGKDVYNSESELPAFMRGVSGVMGAAILTDYALGDLKKKYNNPEIKTEESQIDRWYDDEFSGNINNYRDLLSRCKSAKVSKEDQKSYRQSIQILNNFFEEYDKTSDKKKFLSEFEKVKNYENLYKAIVIIESECKKNNKKDRKTNDSLDHSINKESILDMSIQKKSDKISDQYYKDASKGLSGNDPLMQTFYKEMSAEYNKKLDVKPHKRKDLMDFFHEGAEHIMSQAHPASVVIADAMDDGGLIENNIEHYNISREIAYRKPMGNFK